MRVKKLCLNFSNLEEFVQLSLQRCVLTATFQSEVHVIHARRH